MPRSAIKGNHAVLASRCRPTRSRPGCAHRPEAARAVDRARIELYKDIGTPAQVAERYDFGISRAAHLVGHTRMATESAVTPDRAHPFTAGEDFCLVHNGSLSNPNGVRRMLEPRGIRFETDNDTEAACRFLEWRLREGDDLHAALQKGFEELDGFYTFLMGTADKLALIRDPFACKPAVVAETDDYVAIASASSARWPTCPTSSTPGCSNPRPRRCTYGTHLTFDLAQRAGARLNQFLHMARPTLAAAASRVLNPDGAHNIAVG
jgi:hypothetical protein